MLGFSKGSTLSIRSSRVCFICLNAVLFVIATICFIHALQWINKPFPGFLINQRMVNNGMGQYHWTGTKAGSRTPDKFLSVANVKVSTPSDLQRIVEDFPVGHPILYEIERDGSLLELTIPSMKFGLGDFLVIFGINSLVGLIYFGLGIVVFILKPDTMVSWSFFLLCYCLSSFTLTAFDVGATHLGFVRWYNFVMVVLPAAGLHLSLMFPQPRKILQRFPMIQLLPYVIAVLLIIPDQVLYPGPHYWAFHKFVFIFLIIGALSIIVASLVSYLWQTSVLGRQRAIVVLFGAALAFPLPAVGELAMVNGWTFAGLQVQANFLGIPLVVFPASIAYAIAKHDLFDVDVYIKRTVGYVLMTILVGSLYFTLQTVIRTLVLDPIFGEASEQIYPVLFAIMIVFFFNPISQAIQGLIDRLFFRKKFDYQETITSVSNTLTSLLDQKEVIQTLINTVRQQMFVDAAGVLVLNSPPGDISVFFSGGKEDADKSHEINQGQRISGDPLFDLVRKEKRLVTKYEVAESSRFSEIQEVCGQRFVDLGTSLAVPLIHQNEVRGVLALGYKKSGHFYTREDIQLIETLANQGAVALENAKLVDQMRKEETVRTNLARYLSPQIVDQIIEQDVQVNLGGDRKTVTILFSDIRNFTSITESRPPDQLVSILNDYFTEMARIIFDNQGSLDKYIGDAIVAVFGSLIPLENSALNASRAAVQMIEKMPELNERWQKKYGFGMDMGIGLNTGEVFLGNVGSPERMEFTVIGDTVNVASRFSGLAKAGEILMTRETLTLLDGAVSFQELPPSSVKGKAEKLEVFLVSNSPSIS